MAFTPVNGLEINGNFVTSGIYDPVNGLEIYGDFSGDIPTYRRALLVDNGHIRQISDSETGTGKKPLVMLADGTLKQRQTTEGVPLVTGYLRQLLNNETLLI